jgi:peptidoglycan/LPS O-acetylase OafA/YrhL
MTEAESNRSASELGFMPQLDGLRALAVSAVLLHHLLDPSLFRSMGLSYSLGLLGVRLFFVLSGFLITGILIRGRAAVDARLVRGSGVLRQFYIRRSLRIFPLYYLILILALGFGDAEIRLQLPWLATYTYNLWVAYLGWFPPYFAHFWSLCVEEQFYLFWPWVVLFVPRRLLLGIALTLVAAAPLYRWYALNVALSDVAFYVLTPSSLDALGMGAVLAIAYRSEACVARVVWKMALPIGLAGLLAVEGNETWAAVLGETFVACVFVWAVGAASEGFRGLGRIVLEARPLTYLGKISYGIYVYHPIVPSVVGSLVAVTGLTIPTEGPAGFVLLASVSIGVASLSWHLFEAPILRYKERLKVARIGPRI